VLFRSFREIRNHLERLGRRAGSGAMGGENVRELQARVAELRASLPQDSLHHRRTHPPHRETDPHNHESQTRFYEQRIQAALADMAAHLGTGSQEAGRASPALAQLDVTSRAWLDQRFDSVRGRLEDALQQTATPPPRDDICTALEEARKRLAAMEAKIEDSAERQRKASAKILGIIGPDEDRPAAGDAGLEPSLVRLDARLQSLQDNFDRAMHELEAMKSGTQRLAVRASATIARQTARATAQHVARAVRDAAPEQRFARLDESINGCMTETRRLNHKTGDIQQTLEDGLEDLRGRINELTLITRKVLATAAPAPAGAVANGGPGAGPTSGACTPASATPTRRPAAPQTTARTAPPWWETPMREAEAARNAFGGSFISRLGFALVIVLMIIASFAMLYAQLSDNDPSLMTAPEGVSPTSALPDERSSRRPIEMLDGGPESIVLPGIILTDRAFML
jgi:hypothetical protein